MPVVSYADPEGGSAVNCPWAPFAQSGFSSSHSAKVWQRTDISKTRMSPSTGAARKVGSIDSGFGPKPLRDSRGRTERPGPVATFQIDPREALAFQVRIEQSLSRG